VARIKRASTACAHRRAIEHRAARGAVAFKFIAREHAARRIPIGDVIGFGAAVDSDRADGD
jgi:hypothetical protein